MGEGITITKDAYVELINADLEVLDKYMPDYSLEKKHIKMVLQWSIEKEFPAKYWNKKKTCPDCQGEKYTYFVDQGEPAEEYKCMTCKGTGKLPDVPQPPPPPPPRLLREGGKTIWEMISEWRHRHDKK